MSAEYGVPKRPHERREDATVQGPTRRPFFESGHDLKARASRLNLGPEPQRANGRALISGGNRV